jgi:outer membrane protein TolC
MKILITCSFVIVLGMHQSPAAETNSPVSVTPEFINQLAGQMRSNNPALLAARARTNAAAAGLAAVRTWDDPMLMLGGMAAEKMMREEDGDVIYGVEQKLPLFGRPAAARNVARAELDVSVAMDDEEFQMRRAALAVAVFRSALSDEIVSASDEDLRWLETMAHSIEARYRSGDASLTEWIAVQNEQTKRTIQVQTARDQRTQQHATLNRLLNRPLLQSWPSLSLPPLAQRVEYSDRLARFAATYGPKLRTLREEVRVADAMTEMTRRERRPEVIAAIESRNYSGNGDFRQADFVLRMSLPWFNRSKYQSDVTRNEAKANAARFVAADSEAGLQEEIHALTLKSESARREALAYRDSIIPRSVTAAQSATAAWESGRGMLRDVLETRRMLVESRLMYARAVAEQYEMLSDLILCCGLGDLEALDMIGASPETETTKP